MTDPKKMTTLPLFHPYSTTASQPIPRCSPMHNDLFDSMLLSFRAVAQSVHENPVHFPAVNHRLRLSTLGKKPFSVSPNSSR